MLRPATAGRSASSELATDRKQLTFDVIRPPSDSHDSFTERTVVTRIHHRLRAERQTPGVAAPVAIDCDLDALTDLLAGMMTGARQ